MHVTDFDVDFRRDEGGLSLIPTMITKRYVACFVVLAVTRMGSSLNTSMISAVVPVIGSFLCADPHQDRDNMAMPRGREIVLSVSFGTISLSPCFALTLTLILC